MLREGEIEVQVVRQEGKELKEALRQRHSEIQEALKVGISRYLKISKGFLN